jgi:N-acetylneuraminic acid mutarotase
MWKILTTVLFFLAFTSCNFNSGNDVTNGDSQSQSNGPIISAISDQRSQVNITPTTVSFTISDPNDSLSCATSVSKSSSNQGLIPDQNITVSGSVPNCLLTLSPLSNVLGVSTITLTLTDGSSSSSETFTFTSYNPWSSISTTNAPSARSNHKSVVAEDKMVVWGGGNNLNSGGVFNPSTNSWTTMNLTNAPAGRIWYELVSDDYDVYVIGGRTEPQGQGLNTSFKYDLITDTWSNIASFPDKRYLTASVWTGTHIIVWGGGVTNNLGDDIFVNTGYKYDPVSNTWSPISNIGAPSARRSHLAVWTGDKMIVWGGVYGSLIANSGSYSPSGLASGGGIYDPVTDTWTAIPGFSDSPLDTNLIWTGNNAFIFGGSLWGGLGSGGRVYDIDSNSWSTTSTTNQPSPGSRNYPTTVWSGTHAIVWGGNYSGPLNTGGLYEPTSDTWTPTTTYGGPSARYGHTAVWIGTKMIVWGGNLNGSDTNTGFSFEP